MARTGKTALISDIHANIEALQAVLGHIDAQADIEKIYCLGDLVGYGPNPAEVVDIVRERCEVVVMGNHDQALTSLPLGFSATAAEAIRGQKKELEPGFFSLPSKRARWKFLLNLPEEELDGDNQFVHASPRDKIYEYILPRDPTVNPEHFGELFDLVTVRCFVGHTHIPGVFLPTPAYLSLDDIQYEYPFKAGEKAILNISSVGQPRDRDPRACYATLTEDGVKWHRVEYDLETTIEKIKANPALSDKCGLRLKEGR